VRLNHIHVAVRDLKGALAWLERVWEMKADFENERMATLVFDGFTLILDSADADSPATIGFESDDCDRDFQAFVGRGAVSFEPPENKPWKLDALTSKGPAGSSSRSRGR
jgi:hypothetical protein